MANTMGKRSNGNSGGDESRSNPVGADTVGGAGVVSNSSDRRSESLGLGDSSVLALQRLVHRLVGHLASANSNRGDSSVGNTSNESMSSDEASSTKGTMSSNKASMSANKAKVGNGC